MDDCDRCGSRDISTMKHDVSYNTGEQPPNDVVTVEHCVCNICGAEWVE